MSGDPSAGDALVVGGAGGRGRGNGWAARGFTAAAEAGSAAPARGRRPAVRGSGSAAGTGSRSAVCSVTGVDDHGRRLPGRPPHDHSGRDWWRGAGPERREPQRKEPEPAAGAGSRKPSAMQRRQRRQSSRCRRPLGQCSVDGGSSRRTIHHLQARVATGGVISCAPSVPEAHGTAETRRFTCVTQTQALCELSRSRKPAIFRSLLLLGIVREDDRQQLRSGCCSSAPRVTVQRVQGSRVTPRETP